MPHLLFCSRRSLLRHCLVTGLAVPASGLLAACGANGGAGATETTARVGLSTNATGSRTASSTASATAVTASSSTASTSAAPITITTSSVRKATSTAAVAAPPAAKPGTLTWVTNHSADRVKLFEHMAAQFTQTHPGTQVQVDNVTQNYQQAINTWAAGGSLQDVFYNRTFYTALRAAKGFTVPLNDFLARDHVSADQYYATEMQNCTWQGKIHSLPYDWSIYAIYYNKSMFQQHGVPFPPVDGSWTWNDLLDTAKKFSTLSQGKQSTWGFTGLPNDWALFGVLAANGGKVFSDDGKTCIVANAANVQTLQYFADLRQRWKVTPSPGDIPKGVGDPFAANMIAMEYQGSWAVLDTRAKVGGHFDWDVALLPKGSTGKPPTTGAGGAWSIGHDSKQQAAAWSLLQDITSADSEAYDVGDQAGSLPGNTKATPSYLAAIKQGAQPPQHASLFLGEAQDAFPVPNITFYDRFMQTLDKAVSAIYSGKEAQAELLQVEQEVNAFIPQYQS